LRVLVLNYEYPPLGGGAGNALFHILKIFKLYTVEEFALDVVTSSTGDFEVLEFSHNITIHLLNIGKGKNLHFQTNRELISYAVKAGKYINRLRQEKHFDCIHAFFGIPSGFIAARTGLPYIVSLRGSDVPFYNKRFFVLDVLFFKYLSQWIWKKSRFTIANSVGLKELAKKTCPDLQYDIIYNGVDTEFFVPSTKTKKGKLVLVSIGRLIKRKGYHILLNALREPDHVKLILVGDGDQKNALMRLAESFELDIEFKGIKNKKQVREILSKADIFILPSLNEGMSNSILEAMACGLPIITTDTGGSQELVQGNGIIVPKGSPAALTQAIQRYQNNPELIDKHGSASRIRAEKFSWEHVARKYFQLYKKTIEQTSQ
jgi:glycosyltransferase involved in cell wall biosynthesis